MAIYKNREVTVEHVLVGAADPSRAIIMYPNGARENVKLGDLVVTEDEKKMILDTRTDTFENEIFVLDTESDSYKQIQEDKKLQEEQDAKRNPELNRRDLIKTEDKNANTKSNTEAKKAK